MRQLARLLPMIVLAGACGQESAPLPEYNSPDRGPHSVGSTNLEIAPAYARIGDDAMHQYLLGLADEEGSPKYVADILANPESAWVIDVAVPDDESIYGPASGMTLPVAAYVTFPAAKADPSRAYRFPYHDGQYGDFGHMLEPRATPAFADDDSRYPLIVLAHGASAHGIYDVAHAQRLSSFGYVVAVPIYGDDRTAETDGLNDHAAFLRPLLTRALVDSLLESAAFGPHIDEDNIGISGHSFGGFTALAAAGGPFRGNPATASDPRIKAAVVAAPWVGGNYDGTAFFAFGSGNAGLGEVGLPVLCAFGTTDNVTEASFILPAMKALSGPTYVVELVDQPHIFEPGSWRDRDGWELLFFDAYLKHNEAALEALKVTASMAGGNEDRQRFDYQRTSRVIESGR